MREKTKIFSTKFIAAGKEYCTRDKFIPAPYFRRAFVVSNKKDAKILICGLGFYEIFINGVDITKGKFAPYIANPDHFLYYDEYDVTAYLQEGKNVIGIFLGNGIINSIGGRTWDFDKAPFRSAPKVALSYIEDGKLVFEADEQFKTAPSPLLFDDYRMGEVYDGRKIIEGWNEVDFDDSAWSSCIQAQTPKGTPTLCSVEPIRKHKEIVPVSIHKVENGFLYDFGENTSGTCRLRLSGKCGQEIRMQYGEVLLEGKVLHTKNLCCPGEDEKKWQTDIYVCRGVGEEIYEPHFTFHGFRYVFIEGLRVEFPSKGILTKLSYHSDFSSYSQLKTDNSIINQLQQMTLNSDLSNFFYFPMDCPQREKNGWTADLALSCEQMLYNFDCARSLKEWHKNLCRAQAENGELPGIVPTSSWGYSGMNGPAWDYAIIEIPYQLHKFAGETDCFTENVGYIEKYLHYLLSRKKPNGLFEFGLGDWCECDAALEELYTTPVEITDTLMSIEIFTKVAFLSKITGHKELWEFCEENRRNILCDFRKIYINENCSLPTQTAQAKAISVGVFTEEEKTKAVLYLVKMVRECGHFQVGVIGARVLFRILAENEYHNLAFELITQDSFPSYKTWIDMGMTSLGESFNKTHKNSFLRTDGGRILSQNHHFWGDISAWFYIYILGLRINPNQDNPNAILLKPFAFKKVKYAVGKYERNGNILEWEIKKVGKTVKVHVLKNIGFELLDIQ